MDTRSQLNQVSKNENSKPNCACSCLITPTPIGFCLQAGHIDSGYQMLALQHPSTSEYKVTV